MRPETPSYEVLLSRADALMEQWGELQRREPLEALRGYPDETVESRLARDHGRRSKRDRRQPRFWRRTRRRVEIGLPDDGEPWTCEQCQQRTAANPCEHCGHDASRTVAELRMYPDRPDREGEQGPKATPAWPAEIEQLDRIIARMPQALYRVTWAYYGRGMSVRVGAQVMGIGRGTFERRLESARWYVIGRLEEVDSVLS